MGGANLEVPYDIFQTLSGGQKAGFYGPSRVPVKSLALTKAPNLVSKRRVSPGGLRCQPVTGKPHSPWRFEISWFVEGNGAGFSVPSTGAFFAEFLAVLVDDSRQTILFCVRILSRRTLGARSDL